MALESIWKSVNKINCKLSTWNLIIISIPTTIGERQLLNDQYLYNKNKTEDSVNTYWECVERRSDNGCGVRNTLVDFFKPNWLTHPSSKTRINSCEQDQNQYEKWRQKCWSLTTNIVPANIVTETVLAKIPKWETVRRDIRRQHALATQHPPIQKNAAWDNSTF